MTRGEIRALSDFDLNCELLQHDASQSLVPMPPDYCNSIDELHAIESTLTPEQWARYLFSLFNSDAHIPEADYIDLAVSNEYPYRQNTLMGMFWGLSFTARQRSEALLFVLSEVR